MTRPPQMIDEELSELIQKLTSPQSEVAAAAMAKLVEHFKPLDPNNLEDDSESQTYRKKAIDHGCEGSILKIMKKWPDNENITYIGCVILVNLAAEETKLARMKEETEGISVLARMINNPRFHNEEMLSIAFSALANYAAKMNNIVHLNSLDIETDICKRMSLLLLECHTGWREPGSQQYFILVQKPPSGFHRP